MKRFALLIVSFLSLAFGVTAAFAQAVDMDGAEPAHNPNSLHPIPYADILMKKRVWSQINLKEKRNRPIFSHKKELTKFIIEGVEAGLLTPYNDEAFESPMSKAEFFEKLKLPETDDASEGEQDLGFADDSWGDDTQAKEGQKQEEADYFLPNEVSILEIMEDLIFDKVRSVQVYDTQSIKLIIPAEKFETGLRREVGIFKYKDLAAYLDEQNVLWLNLENVASSIKATEAFELRLFSSGIVKLENPEDKTIADIYGDTPKAAALAAKELQERLLEEEYFLWEH